MSALAYRYANSEDASLLAAMNQQLIEDEQNRNRLSLAEIERRMRGWLEGEYRAVIFQQDAEPVAYAVYRPDGSGVYLRQLFVARHCRRQGIGREALKIFRDEVLSHGLRVTIDVLAHNRRAHAFWTAVGFRDYAVIMEM